MGGGKYATSRTSSSMLFDAPSVAFGHVVTVARPDLVREAWRSV